MEKIKENVFRIPRTFVSWIEGVFVVSGSNSLCRSSELFFSCLQHAVGGATDTAGTTGDTPAGSEGKKDKKRGRGRNHQRPNDRKPPQGDLLCPEVATGVKCKFGEW